jgi:hypothetical protein
MSGGLFWGAWCGIAAMIAVILSLRQYLGQSPEWPLLLRMASASLPVYTILVFVNVLSEEVEQRLLSYLYTLPTSIPRLLLERSLLAVAGMLIAWLALMGSASIAQGGLPFKDLLAASALVLPGNLLIGLAALLATLMSRSIVGGLLLAFLYYLVELTSPNWPGPIFLIWRGLPVDIAEVWLYSLSVSVAAFVMFALLLFASVRAKPWIVRSK